MAEITSTNGYTILIDDADFERVNRFRWCVLVPRNKRPRFAKTNVKIDGKYTTLLLHRFLTDAPEGLQVDHINHNTLDNRRKNLRICTASQNGANRQCFGGSSIYKGVSHWRNGQFQSYIRKDRKMIKIGYFDNEIEAARAYDKKAVELFGEFA